MCNFGTSELLLFVDNSQYFTNYPQNLDLILRILRIKYFAIWISISGRPLLVNLLEYKGIIIAQPIAQGDSMKYQRVLIYGKSVLIFRHVKHGKWQTGTDPSAKA